MATANDANITLRSEKLNPLTYSEMDANFTELKNVIADAVANESSISSINSSITQINSDITNIENQLPGFLEANQNLSDLTDVAQARSNLGNVLTQGQSDARYLNESSNLSDIPNASTARNNLGLGDIVTRDIFISTSDPSNSNGANGDIWLTYQ